MPFAVGANLLILLVVLVGPFLSHWIEHNLEGFLFIMRLLAALAAGVLSLHLLADGAADQGGHDGQREVSRSL